MENVCQIDYAVDVEKLKFPAKNGWLWEGSGTENIHKLPCKRLIQSNYCIGKVY